MKFKSLSTNPIVIDRKVDSHGWLQWKGSDISMDVFCKCGHSSHISGEFIYFLECPSCGTVYELNGHIQLIERDRNEIDCDIDNPQK